jgi:hypothetical protein
MLRTTTRKVDEISCLEQRQPPRVERIISDEDADRLGPSAQTSEVLDAHARPTLWTGGCLEASGRRQDDDSSRPSAHVLQKHPVDVLHLRQVLARPD